MVVGFCERPTRAPCVIQCGETISTARGRGKARPSALSCGPARPGSSAKVGAPCEMKTVGKRVMRFSCGAGRRAVNESQSARRASVASTEALPAPLMSSETAAASKASANS
ncbi:hypothetical protein D9M69_655160 [compost metagenome]